MRYDPSGLHIAELFALLGRAWPGTLPVDDDPGDAWDESLMTGDFENEAHH
jgi:hypothetical protein